MSQRGYNSYSPSSTRLSPNTQYSGTSKPRYREPSKSSEPSRSDRGSGGRTDATRSQKDGKSRRRDASTLECHGDEYSRSSPCSKAASQRASPVTVGQDATRGSRSGSKPRASGTRSRQDRYPTASPSCPSLKGASSFDSSRDEHQTASPSCSSEHRESHLRNRNSHSASPTRLTQQRPSKVESTRSSHIRAITQTSGEEESSYGADQVQTRHASSLRTRSEQHTEISNSGCRRPRSEQYVESTRCGTSRLPSENYTESPRSGSRRAPSEHYTKSVPSGRRRSPSEQYAESARSGSLFAPSEHYTESARSGSRHAASEQYDESIRSGSRYAPSEQCDENPRCGSRHAPSEQYDENPRNHSCYTASEQYAESDSYAGSCRPSRSQVTKGSHAGSVCSGSRYQESGTYSRAGESRPYNSRTASVSGSISQGLGGTTQSKAESRRQYDSYEGAESADASGTISSTIHEEDGNYEEDDNYNDCESAVPSYRDEGESASYYSNEELNEQMEMRYAGLFEAVEEGNANEAGRILKTDKQIDLNTVNAEDETCLMLASRIGHVEVVRMLLKHGAKFEFKATPESLTPLVLGAKENHLEVVQELLSFGAYPDQTDEFAHTPLFYACANGNDDMVRILINSGANVNTFARVKNAQLVEEMNNIESAFNWPYGKQEHPWDDVGEGKTPLHLAARFGYEAIMILLIQKGAYVDAQDDRGRTAVWWAAAKGHVECLRRLVRSYAHLDAPDGEGNTPLMWAVRLSQLETVGVLLDFGANVNYRNPKSPKNAPLEWAIRHSNEKMVHTLRAEGAVPEQPVCAIM